MTSKHNAKHPFRGMSAYSIYNKGNYRDRYGKFHEGRQTAQDVIRGRSVWAILPTSKGDK